MAEDTPSTRAAAAAVAAADIASPAPSAPLVAPQQFSVDVLLEKYAKGDEQSADDVFQRVARGVAQAESAALRESVEALFVDNLRHGALGAGRIMSAAGTGIAATLINCFVQPVGDAIQGVDERGPARHLCRVTASGRNHAARRRRRL